MPERLSVAAEDAIVFRRRPEEPPLGVFPRRLASNSTSPYKFAFSRTALKYGLAAIGFKPGDALLVPEFVCEALVEPLETLGIKPQYYPINPTLEPDWHQLAKITTKLTKALLVVHYFGQPQSIQRCLEFCRENSLMFVEDNAHGFGGNVDGQLLGTFGDLGVSAPRKSFPIFNGAYLYTAKDVALGLSALQLQPIQISSLQHRLKHWIRKIPPVDAMVKYRNRISERRRRLGPPARYGSQDAFREPPLREDYGMDESSESFLQRQDMNRVGELRQQIYHVWQRWTSTQGLVPVFPSLAPGAMPLVFPAYTESAASSLKWFERGHRAGVDVHSWPTLPQAIIESGSGALRLWERLLCFPIHQDMNVRLLERRLGVL
jgi:hypothetical protein